MVISSSMCLKKVTLSLTEYKTKVNKTFKVCIFMPEVNEKVCHEPPH